MTDNPIFSVKVDDPPAVYSDGSSGSGLIEVRCYYLDKARYRCEECIKKYGFKNAGARSNDKQCGDYIIHYHPYLKYNSISFMAWLDDSEERRNLLKMCLKDLKEKSQILKREDAVYSKQHAIVEKSVETRFSQMVSDIVGGERD
jgi:hypothetical protein